MHIKDEELSPTWPPFALHWLYNFVTVIGDPQVLKKECPGNAKHLEFNNIQPFSSSFLPFHDIGTFPPVKLLNGHQQEDSGVSGGSWWKCVKQAAEKASAVSVY